MEDTIQQLVTYLRAIWKRRWIVLLVTILVCGIGWPVVLAMPDTYRVSAKIELDTQSILKPLLRNLAVDNSLTQQTALLLQNTILTRPNLEKIAKAVDLDHQALTPQEFNSVINRLATNIQINRVNIRLPDPRQRVNDVFVIEYEDSEPELAKRIVEETLTLFIEKTLGVARKDTKTSGEFLTSQIKEYENKLIEAENRLKDFKRENIGLMPREGESFYTRLTTETSRLEEARLALNEAIQRRDEIQNQINALLNSADQGEESRSVENLSPLETRIQNMQTRLDELLLQFTDDHPDVVSTRRIVDSLKAQKAQQRQGSGSESEARLLENNPVYQDLKVRLGEQEAEVAALRVRINLYEKNVRELNSRIDTMPAIEAELANLNRDYTVLRTNYEELVKRRESARISFDAETKGGDISFKILEPPRVPLVPIWPNRPLLETAVLVAGIALGAGIAILLMLIRTTFTTITSLKDKFDIPVYGSVSMVTSQNDVARDRVNLVIYASSCMLVLAMYVVIVSSHIFNFTFLS